MGDPADKPKASDSPRIVTSSSDALLAVLGAIGTGIGGLGLLTFMGGAISLARFRGAGLSGTEGVSVVPKQELLAIGSDQLLLPMLIALAASAALCASYYHLVLRRPHRLVVLVGLWVVGEVYFVMKVGVPRKNFVPFALATIVGLVGAFAAATVADELAVGKKPKEALPRGFLALGAVVFATVTMVVSVTSFGRSLAFPVVRAAAVLRQDDTRGLWGFYVGQTDDHVYIGLSPPKPDNAKQGIHSRGRIIALPKATIAGLSIGSLQSLPRARKTGPRLLDELVAIRPQADDSTGQSRQR